MVIRTDGDSLVHLAGCFWVSAEGSDDHCALLVHWGKDEGIYLALGLPDARARRMLAAIETALAEGQSRVDLREILRCVPLS